MNPRNATLCLFLFALTGNAILAAEPVSRGFEICEVIEAPAAASGEPQCCGIPTHACAADTKLGERIVDHSMVADVRLKSEPGVRFPEVRNYLEIQLTPEGAKVFEEGATRNRNKRLAVLIDGKVVALPVIQEPVRGGIITWAGNSNQETLEAAEKLRKASGK